jgi:GntR family transcriptional repressor for pyruvate dehydrogenase complex
MTQITGLHTFQRKDIRDQVFDELFAQITSGNWKPGTKIPSENELTKAMNVSRITIREAIQKLAAMDLVETHRGKGTFVKEFTTANYLKSLTPMVLLSKDDLKYIVEYRRILEVGIIELFMKNVTESNIKRLEEDLMNMIAFKQDLSKYQLYDLDFHLTLYEMTNNPFIIKVTNMIRDILDSEMKTAITEKGAEEGIRFHTNILKYIKANDINSLVKETNELFDTIMKDLNEIND